eukprot:6874602-Ditylum_brightwellii.AAC.1
MGDAIDGNGTFIVQTKERDRWKGGIVCEVYGSDLFFRLWVIKYKRVTLGAFAKQDTFKGVVLEFLLFYFAIFQFADICFAKNWKEQLWVRLLVV